MWQGFQVMSLHRVDLLLNPVLQALGKGVGWHRDRIDAHASARHSPLPRACKLFLQVLIWAVAVQQHYLA